MVRFEKARLISRRQFVQAGTAAYATLANGCIGSSSPQTGTLEKVWGLAGSTPGRLFRPRAIAIDKDDLLYLVDMTPQIQVFTGDGVFLRGWQTPIFEHGQIGR